MTNTKIFLSYAYSDKKFIDRLCRSLDSHGISYWRDSKEILVGDSITERIESGLRESDIFCLCLSKSSVTKPWVLREYRTALNLQLSSTKKSLIIMPILIEDCEIPELLKDIRFADFSRSFTEGFRSLCKVLSIQFSIPFQNRIPYQELLFHIESKESLKSFVQSAREGKIYNLPEEWIVEMFSLLKKGVLDTVAELNEFLKTNTQLIEIPIDSKPPYDVQGIPMLLTSSIKIVGDFDSFSDDLVDPYTTASSTFGDFLDVLLNHSDGILKQKVFLLPESFKWDIYTYPDGYFDESIDLSHIIRVTRK